MDTYKEVQDYITKTYDKTVKTCWIAHVKEINGLIDKNPNRKYPCPNEYISIIEEALKYIGVL